MNMSYQKRNDADTLNAVKKLFQWSHYQGGIPLVFIVFGLILTFMFALFSYWYNYNWTVLMLGVVFIILGLFLEYYSDEQ